MEDRRDLDPARHQLAVRLRRNTALTCVNARSCKLAIQRDLLHVTKALLTGER